MQSEAISLFYDEPAPAPVRASAPPAPAPAPAPPAPVPDLAPGQLVRWTTDGIPHVGRVEKVADGLATLTYGPMRATFAVEELTPIEDKDGQGRPR
jgi:hypothetical protein